MLVAMVIQEYITTTLPMMVNTLMRLVSIMLQRLLGDNPDDTAQMQKVTLPQFIVRTDDFKVLII